MDWSQSGGDMGRRICALDWAATPLGPRERWPSALTAAVGIILATRQPAILFWGPRYVAIYNDAYTGLLGPEKHPAMLGQPGHVGFAEAWHVAQPQFDAIVAGGAPTWWENQRVPIVRNGRIEDVYWTYTCGPVHDPSAPTGVGGVLVFCTETTPTVTSLRDTESRYRQLFESMDEGFVVGELVRDENGRPVDFRYVEANAAHEALVRRPRAEVIGRTASELWPEHAAQRLATYVPVVESGEPLRQEYFAEALGAWFDIRVFSHGPDRFAVVYDDITARKDAERRLREGAAQLEVLNAELQHRTRNLMAVVQAMTDATLRTSTDLDDFRERFADRLQALGRVQSLLSGRVQERVTFDQLVESELASVGGFELVTGRVRLQGPSNIALRSNSVQTLAMALHELATNAAKHGALKQPQGLLSVRWELRERPGAEPLLFVDWRESNVRVEPARGRGHGRQLIERALPMQLNARTHFALTRDGVHCTIEVPVPAPEAQGATSGP